MFDITLFFDFMQNNENSPLPGANADRRFASSFSCCYVRGNVGRLDARFVTTLRRYLMQPALLSA